MTFRHKIYKNIPVLVFRTPTPSTIITRAPIWRIVKTGPKIFRISYNYTTTTLPLTTVVYDKNDICADPQYTNELSNYMFAFISLILGIYYLTYGYRFFKITMFSAGFATMSTILYVIISFLNFVLPLHYNILINLFIGVLFGLFTLLFELIGIFVFGHQASICTTIFALAMYNSLNITPVLTHSTNMITTIGIIGACFNLYFKKGLTIYSTSAYGSTMILLSLDFFIYQGTTVNWVYGHLRTSSNIGQLCNSWIFLVLWPILIIFGNFIQWRYTGVGCHHEEDGEEQDSINRLVLPTWQSRSPRF